MGLLGDAVDEPGMPSSQAINLLADDRWLDLDGAGSRLAEADSLGANDHPNMNDDVETE
ncbi:hypothetical protein [Sorangium sp. So ce887]|uniref:hypothetical protein n=1 Tax=Sorangium sp. So ce887 TaxID=3133324 RepID=UPI003F5D5FFE